MMVKEILDEIGKARVVSIVRGIAHEDLKHVADALYEGGIRAIEVTLDTPAALKMIEELKSEYSTKMIIGAGTVLDAETARSAILSGADFVLSPTLSTGVIEMCHRYSKVAVPGALTPTEILTAWEAGAQIVKVFPARVFGPAYIKDIKGPLAQIELMPVGGVSLDNAAEFIKCGAFALGVGSEMVSRTKVAAKDFDSIRDTAAAFIKTAQ